MSEHDPKMRIEQLYTYPIKSLRGTTTSTAIATYTGFIHDRCFMLYRPSDKKNMHVSQYPEMCLFTTEIRDSKIIVRYAFDHTFDHPEQKLSDAGSTLEVDLEPSTADLTPVQITMHSSPATGYDMGPACNSWFAARFGYPVQLLYTGNQRRKVLGNVPPHIAAAQRDGLMGSSLSSTETSPLPPSQPKSQSWLTSLTSSLPTSLFTSSSSPQNPTPSYPGVDQGITFADCAPYLITSSTSHADASARLHAPDASNSITHLELPVDKFRPNIVVSGSPAAYDEDFWAELEIIPASSSAAETSRNAVTIVLTANCGRCNSLNVDYSTGKVGSDASGKVLKLLQKDRRVDQGWKWSPIFGRYGFLAATKEREGKEEEGTSAGTGTGPGTVGEGAEDGGNVRINVGDEVRVVRRNGDRGKFEWPGLGTS